MLEGRKLLNQIEFLYLNHTKSNKATSKINERLLQAETIRTYHYEDHWKKQALQIFLS